MATATARLKKQPAAVINPGPTPLPGGVEIYASQPAFKIQQGKTKTINLIGALYGNIQFIGTITVEPNSPRGSTTNVACPILQAPVSQPHVPLQPGANEVIIAVTFFCPANTPKGNYNCALRYTAVPDNSNNTNVAKGNEVDIGYLVVAAR
jgi:hypothetical protein